MGEKVDAKPRVMVLSKTFFARRKALRNVHRRSQTLSKLRGYFWQKGKRIGAFFQRQFRVIYRREVRRVSEVTKFMSDRNQAAVKSLLKLKANRKCADCLAPGPSWASANLGVFICIRCAGIHRCLGTHISRVRSVHLDTWQPAQVDQMRTIGNAVARDLYEYGLSDQARRRHASRLQRFIEEKYVHRKWHRPADGEARPPVDPVDDVPGDEARVCFHRFSLTPLGQAVAGPREAPPLELPQLTITLHNDLAKISLLPPEGDVRTPCDVCCIIDVSGSMGSSATLKTDTGTEAHGLTLLDVVKHAVKTIIHVLDERDRLSLVAFQSSTFVVFELVPMDAPGKRLALAELEQLNHGGGTNLWEGLEHGLDVMQRGMATALPHAARCCILLTDGQPTTCPPHVPSPGEPTPENHVEALRRYRDSHGGKLGCSVQTFGFGYGLMENLLEGLADEGGEMFGFIPDSSFVGTVFVNALSNLQTVLCSDVTLSLETKNGTTIEEVFGGFPTIHSDWGARIIPGPLRFGQSRDVVVRLGNLPKDADVEFLTTHVDLAIADQPLRLECQAASRCLQPELVPQDVLVHWYRSRVSDLVTKSVGMPDNDIVRVLADEILGSEVADVECMTELVKDLTGQIHEATSRVDFYQKWGRFYLPSLARAHRLEVCSNFKDPGVQHYGGGGKLFEKLRDEADKVFLDLPPPKPSRPTSSGRRAPQLKSMARYHSSYAPCFAGRCQIAMFDGSLLRCDAVKKGDRVASGAFIECIVETVSPSGFMDLVRLNDDIDLWITPWHPVCLSDEWKFPVQVPGARVSFVSCPAVYSFVLSDPTSTLIVEGIEAAAMGHDLGKRDSLVLDHPFFGSRVNVMSDLKKMRGFRQGKVTLVGGKCLIRDSSTGLVCGLQK